MKKFIILLAFFLLPCCGYSQFKVEDLRRNPIDLTGSDTTAFAVVQTNLVCHECALMLNKVLNEMMKHNTMKYYLILPNSHSVTGNKSSIEKIKKVFSNQMTVFYDYNEFGDSEDSLISLNTFGPEILVFRNHKIEKIKYSEMFGSKESDSATESRLIKLFNKYFITQ